LRDRARAARAEVLHGIVRILDDQMNNELDPRLRSAARSCCSRATRRSRTGSTRSGRRRTGCRGHDALQGRYHAAATRRRRKSQGALKRRSSDESDKDRLFSVMSTMAGKHERPKRRACRERCSSPR
jgi:hypothetical protein